MDLQWLRDQLDEDADLVARNSDGHGLSEGFPDYRTYDGPELEAADEYVDVFGPAWVLREIDAKRDLLRFAQGIYDHHETFTTGVASRLEQTLRLFALAYEGRPGFKEEWRP